MYYIFVPILFFVLYRPFYEAIDSILIPYCVKRSEVRP